MGLKKWFVIIVGFIVIFMGSFGLTMAGIYALNYLNRADCCQCSNSILQLG